MVVAVVSGGGAAHVGWISTIASADVPCMSVERTKGCVSGLSDSSVAASDCATSYIRFQSSSESPSARVSKRFAPFCTKFLILCA